MRLLFEKNTKDFYSSSTKTASHLLYLLKFKNFKSFKIHIRIYLVLRVALTNYLVFGNCCKEAMRKVVCTDSL